MTFRGRVKSGNSNVERPAAAAHLEAEAGGSFIGRSILHPRFRRRLLWILLGGILLTAFVLRLLYVQLHLHEFELSGDALNYQLMSWQWVEDGIYGYALKRRSGVPNAYVTPGYPALLAAVYALVRDPYRQITVVRLIQVMLGTATVALGFLTVRRLLNRTSVALLAAFFMAVYPPYVQSTAQVLTEVLALFTMVLYFWLQAKGLEENNWRWNSAAGLAFAAQVLVRPVLLPLAPLPFLCVLVARGWGSRHQVAKAALWTGSVAFVLMLPWWARNVFALHMFVLTSTGSANPFLAGTYPYLRDMFSDFSAGGYKLEDQGWFAFRRLRVGLSREPLLYLRWYTVGKLRFTFGEPWLYQALPQRGDLAQVAMVGHQIVSWLGLAGLLLGTLRRRVLGFTLLYLTLFTALYLAFIPTTRYAYQLMFFLLAGAAWLICSLIDNIGSAVSGSRLLRSAGR